MLVIIKFIDVIVKSKIRMIFDEFFGRVFDCFIFHCADEMRTHFAVIFPLKACKIVPFNMV